MTTDCLSLSLERAKPTPQENSLEGFQVETAKQVLPGKPVMCWHPQTWAELSDLEFHH